VRDAVFAIALMVDGSKSVIKLESLAEIRIETVLAASTK
jgi:hypothetical protein